MRAFQHKQILDLLQTIEQAQSAGLYSDCQNGALFLCDLIENIVGGDADAINLLLQYCELLFRANGGESMDEQLSEQFKKIESNVLHKLNPDKIEVLFLSYKASMSDALESIYFAAKNDPDCEAIWMPIPYIEFNADRTIAKTVCERGEHYPAYIECTDWQEYNIEERRPDVIYTFNPYDGSNFVTSVYPQFYTEHLRNFTDMLVYIPYFVVDDHIKNHFATVSGCVFAHKVIVQSEKIRDKYIESFKEVYGEQEDKFVALGSPKFDKVINATRKNFDIPEDWRKIISGKKVVLYNTSISMLLNENEEYLNKIRHVLKTFAERDDIVLWWRPHPLNVASYKALRPELLDEYRQIIEAYKKSASGIYDDTSDLHRAITSSDAYYGDASSVVLLYAATGKPVMISDCTQQENRYVHLNSFQVLDNHIIALVKGTNRLFEMSDYILNPIVDFPEQANPSFPKYLLYCMAAEKNAAIYFAPSAAKKIAVYTFNSNTFETTPHDFPSTEMEKELRFFCPVPFQDYVFFTPYYYPAIARLDTVTNEITFFTDWVRQVRKLVESPVENFFMKPEVVDDVIWLASCGGNAVVEFNMKTCESTVHEVGQKGNRYSNILFDGENFWLTPFSKTDTPLVKWHPKHGVLKEFHDLFPETYAEYKHFFSGIYSSGFVWLVTQYSNCVLKINIHTHEINTVDELQADCEKDDGNRNFSFVYFYKNKIYFCKNQTNTFVEYNCETRKRDEYILRYSDEAIKHFKEAARQVFLTCVNSAERMIDLCFTESGITRLEDYLSHLIDGKFDEEQTRSRAKIAQGINTNADGTAGKHIHEHVKKCVSR